MPARPVGRGHLVAGLGVVLGAFIPLDSWWFTSPTSCRSRARTRPTVHDDPGVPDPREHPPDAPLVAFTAMDVAVGLSVSVVLTVAGTQNGLAEPTKRGILLFARAFTPVWIFFGTYAGISVLASVRDHVSRANLFPPALDTGPLPWTTRPPSTGCTVSNASA